MRDFSFNLDIVKSLEKVKSGDRVVVGYASTYDVDSDDTQITREALEGAKKDLLTYSTVLFNHDMDRPIGKVVDTEVDDIGLLVKVILSKEEDEIWKKVKEGVIAKFSIKGRAKEFKPVEGKKLIYQITEIELFEVSLVTVPANKEAKTLSYWVAKSFKEQDLEKGIVPRHSPVKADEGRSWSSTAANKRLKIWASSDGSGSKEKINWTKYAKGFVWFDSTDKENFGSYKLPHHDIVNGKLVTVWRGVAAAMAALSGARGGLNVPQSDRSAIYSHLARHYKQFGKEVPEVNKSLSTEDETSTNNTTNKMEEIIKELNDILSKENSEEIKTKLTELVKKLEIEEDLLAKLELVSGKLSGEDKDVVDSAIETLKTKQASAFNHEELADETKSFDLADESEERPVFQLNDSTEVELEDEAKGTFKKQLLKFGKWFHWDADGGVLNITEEVVDNIIKNFKKGIIEHVSVPLKHTDDPTKNTGEVVKLEKTDKGLDAVIEIKDATILEKIKNGLIKCVSASLDPNYRVKTSNKFVGPTLLHAALVSEPFIKGMGNFVQLSEEFKDRQIIQLEDEEPNVFEAIKSLKGSLQTIEDKILTAEQVKDLFGKMTTDDIFSNTTSDEEATEDESDETKEEEKTEEAEEKTEEETTEEEVTEEKTEEAAEEANEEKTEEAEEKTEEEETSEEATEEENDEIEEEIEKKESIFAVVDGKKGQYIKEGDKIVFKELSDEEIKEIEKGKFQSCMSRQMKKGKTMAESAKYCRKETNKSIEKMFTEESSSNVEDKSDGNDASVDFSDAERVYEEYLNQGKIVPAQKETFIKLMSSKKKIELGDDKVGVTELLKSFMDSQSPVINFEEEGVTTTDDETEKKEEKTETVEVPAEAKDFFEKMGLSDEDAARSWKYAKSAKEEEDGEKSTIFD